MVQTFTNVIGSQISVAYGIESFRQLGGEAVVTAATQCLSQLDMV